MSRDFLDSAIAAVFCFVGACVFAFFLALFGFLSGCATTVKHEVPQLDSVGEAMKKIVIKDCKKPTLAMPPIPPECVIDIRGDVMTASSKDCENLIRYYVQARSLLRPASAGAPASSDRL
jgi:hypothetical protein